MLTKESLKMHFLHLFIVCGGVVRVWRSEDNLHELIHSFHCVGLGAQTEGVTLSGKCLYLLNHLTGPVFLFFFQDSLTQPRLALNSLYSQECTPDPLVFTCWDFRPLAPPNPVYSVCVCVCVCVELHLTLS